MISMSARSAVCSGLSGAAIWGAVLLSSSVSPPIACITETCSVHWKSMALSSPSPPLSPESPESESDSDVLLSSLRTHLAEEGDREVTTVGGWRLYREGCCWEWALGVLCIETSVVVAVLGLRKASKDP